MWVGQYRHFTKVNIAQELDRQFCCTRDNADITYTGSSCKTALCISFKKRDLPIGRQQERLLNGISFFSFGVHPEVLAYNFKYLFMPLPVDQYCRMQVKV